MIFKFWKWRISIKVKKLDADERIAFLTNSLIKELQESGRQVLVPDGDNNFGCIMIYAHRVHEDDWHVDIVHTTPRWVLKIKPDFGELKNVEGN